MGKWVHRLSEIDPEGKTAHCAFCGPVGLREYASGRLVCENARRLSAADRYRARRALEVGGSELLAELCYRAGMPQGDLRYQSGVPAAPAAFRKLRPGQIKWLVELVQGVIES